MVSLRRARPRFHDRPFSLSGTNLEHHASIELVCGRKSWPTKSLATSTFPCPSTDISAGHESGPRPPFQGGSTGSNPVGATLLLLHGQHEDCAHA